MPTPQESIAAQALISHPFVQEVSQIANSLTTLASLFVQQGLSNSLPFSNTPVTPAFNANAQGASQLTQEIALGLAQIKAQVAALQAPVVDVNTKTPGVGGPVVNP